MWDWNPVHLGNSKSNSMCDYIQIFKSAQIQVEQ